MTSIGESDLVVVSKDGITIVGKVRVLNIFADSALFPRLGLTLGVTILDRPEVSVGPEELSFVKCEMREALGELRLSESGDAVGEVIWAGPHRYVRSSSYGGESQVKFVCSLDHWRLEQIERRRGGQPPRFWLQVWPLLVLKGQPVDSDIRTIELRVPREQWLEFYSKVGGFDIDVLEIRYSGREAEQFQRAIARSREARMKIANGDFDGAVALCRNAIEALTQELSDTGEDDPLVSFLTRMTDERRAKEYLGVVSRVKQLAGFAHHEFGAPVTYSRAEAQFTVRLTEALLSLVGSFSAASGGVKS